MSYTWAWKGVTSGGRAHLVVGEVVHTDGIIDQAVCGVSVDRSRPYAERCQSCVTSITSLAALASQPPPKRVREQLCITVERHASGESIEDVVLRKLRTATAIKVIETELFDLGSVKED